MIQGDRVRLSPDTSFFWADYNLAKLQLGGASVCCGYYGILVLPRVLNSLHFIFHDYKIRRSVGNVLRFFLLSKSLGCFVWVALSSLA